MTATCPNCHHVVESLADERRRARCPNCGATLPASAAATAAATPVGTSITPAPSTDGVALAAFVVSLLFFVPFLTQIVAVVLALIALFRPRSHGQGRGLGLAFVAIILSCLVCAIWIALLTKIVRARSAVSPAIPPAYGYGGYGRGGGYGAGFDEAAMEQASAIKACMEAIAPAARGYMRDYQRWPDSIEALVPVYLSQYHLDTATKETDKGEQWIRWVAQIDAQAVNADRIVAHSLVVRHDDTGERLAQPMRWALYYSGRIALLPVGDIDTRLPSAAEPDSPSDAAAATRPSAQSP